VLERRICGVWFEPRIHSAQPRLPVVCSRLRSQSILLLFAVLMVRSLARHSIASKVNQTSKRPRGSGYPCPPIDS
jgi:hypothetical protein